MRRRWIRLLVGLALLDAVGLALGRAIRTRGGRPREHDAAAVAP